MTSIECALRLEKACEKLTGSRYILQENFLHKPTEAIQEAFSYMVAQNVLKTEDISYLYAYYDFGETTLNEILKDSISAERIKELLNQLDTLYKETEQI